MTWRFDAIPDPTEELCTQAASLDPANPFCTGPYFAAMKGLGQNPLLLVWRDEDRVVAGCVALLREGRLQRTLSIPSLPAVPDGTSFYQDLLGYCMLRRVTRLRLETYASTSERIPPLAGELVRRQRREYVVPLDDEALPKMSSNHRRNVARARKAGVTIQVTDDPDQSASHVGLMKSSMQRRSGRGEKVSTRVPADTHAALVRHGCGRFYQAFRGSELMSSVLVLLAEQGGYYHSAGTSREGMSSGASHFLLSEIMSRLRENHLRLFNLGGIDASTPGLERFKAGFGSTPIDLEASQAFVGGPLQRALCVLADRAKDMRRRLRA